MDAFRHPISEEDYDELAGVARDVLSRIADAIKKALEAKFYAVRLDIEVEENGYLLRSSRVLPSDQLVRMHELADGIVIGYMVSRDYYRRTGV